MIDFIKTETITRVRVSDYDFPPTVVPHIPVLIHQSTYATGEMEIKFHTLGENCDEYAQVAGDILTLLLPYDRCAKGRIIKAEVFMSDCPKYLPPEGAVLGRDHVNTGYTHRCSSDALVVYRKEEWVKVFIHESMHHFKLDDGMEAVRLPMFGVPAVVETGEAYCEVWARILNCYLVAARTGKSVKRLLAQERRYAVRNMVRVLAHMGLTYADLRAAKAVGYREDTNVFAYVVLGAILMNDPAEFQREFQGFRGNTSQLLKLIEKQMNSPAFLKEVRNPSPKTSRMRMSAIKLF